MRIVNVVVGEGWGAIWIYRRMSHWSSGEIVGMKVRVSECPTCVSDEVIRKSARGL